jgi:hypothetical protein
MIHAYTRDLVQRMTGGAEGLVPLERIIDGAHIGLCPQELAHASRP